MNGDELVLNHVLDRAPIAKAACDEASHDREAFEQQLFAGLDPCASPGGVASPVSPAGPIWMSQRGTGRPSAAGRLPPAAAKRRFANTVQIPVTKETGAYKKEKNTKLP